MTPNPRHAPHPSDHAARRQRREVVVWALVGLVAAVLLAPVFRAVYPLFPDDWSVNREEAAEIALERFRDLGELALDDAPQLALALEDGGDAIGLAALLLELLADQIDLELGELVELQLQDGLGLDVVESKLRHDLVGGILLAIACADELDEGVECIPPP